MAKNLFVGSLPFAVDDAELRELFGEFGTVESAKVISDRETGRSRGFGFVEMSSDDEAQAAIKAMDGKELSGRAIAVNEARPKEDRGQRSFQK
jgi:RNA recognition motif-containing protein